MESSSEMNQRMEEASKDEIWAKKLRAAVNWEEYVMLLAEKGIEAPEELKEALSVVFTDRNEKLEDDDLEKVSGGWTPIFNCPQEYNELLCRFTCCPHRAVWDRTPDEEHYSYHCKLHNWTQVFQYGGN